MKVSERFGAFTVMECDKCNNVVYVKKGESSKPKLIDD